MTTLCYLYNILINLIFHEPELSLHGARLRLVAARGIVPGEGQESGDGEEDRGTPGGDEGGPEPEEAAGANDPMLPVFWAS